MIHVCRDVLPWAPGSGEGHCHSLASPETDLGASVQEAFQVRCQDSACRGLGVQLGCEAVTAEVSGPHACSRAGVVLQSCVDRSLVAALPGRGHALVGGGADTAVKPLQSNALATGETLTLALKGGWVMHHDWCPVTSPAGHQVG